MTRTLQLILICLAFGALTAAKAEQAGRDSGDLGRMLADRPIVPVTAAREDRQPDQPVSELPVEGTRIVARRAWLGYDVRAGWYTLHFVGPYDGPPLRDLRVLPNYLLAAMESVLAEHPDPVFEITGEITVYRGQAYILLVNAAVDTAPVPVPDAAAAPQPATAPLAAVDEPSGPPSAKDVLAQMLADEPAKPIAPVAAATRTPPQAAAVAPVAAGAGPVATPRGMIVWRLVRILPGRDGEWMEVRFTADNTLQEPPIRVLPSSMLERAEALGVAGKGRTVRLRVTGQITRYKGRRHLLLRNMMLERRLGQF